MNIIAVDGNRCPENYHKDDNGVCRLAEWEVQTSVLHFNIISFNCICSNIQCLIEFHYCWN